MSVKEHIYEYTLTNTDNELYCYSKEFHSHLPFDRPCLNQLDKLSMASDVTQLSCSYRTDDLIMNNKMTG